jgi:hypothetical protein
LCDDIIEVTSSDCHGISSIALFPFTEEKTKKALEAETTNSTQNSTKKDDAKEDKDSDFEVIEGEDSDDSSNKKEPTDIETTEISDLGEDLKAMNVSFKKYNGHRQSRTYIPHQDGPSNTDSFCWSGAEPRIRRHQ